MTTSPTKVESHLLDLRYEWLLYVCAWGVSCAVVALGYVLVRIPQAEVYAGWVYPLASALHVIMSRAFAIWISVFLWVFSVEYLYHAGRMRRPFWRVYFLDLFDGEDDSDDAPEEPVDPSDPVDGFISDMFDDPQVRLKAIAMFVLAVHLGWGLLFEVVLQGMLKIFG